MEKYKKFFAKLPVALRLKLIKTVCQIADGDLKNLDIKVLESKYEIYRCRVGKVRILFQKNANKYQILDVGFRGDVYRNV